MGKTVYVGNTGHEITDGKLRELFTEHGDVIEVRVVTDHYTGRPKGFAFVDMATEEAARAAISEVDGQRLGDRQLRVAEARPRGWRESEQDLYTSSSG
jgi:RNA recognition motif-containing protein